MPLDGYRLKLDVNEQLLSNEAKPFKTCSLQVSKVINTKGVVRVSVVSKPTLQVRQNVAELAKAAVNVADSGKEPNWNEMNRPRTCTSPVRVEHTSIANVQKQNSADFIERNRNGPDLKPSSRAHSQTVSLRDPRRQARVLSPNRETQPCQQSPRRQTLTPKNIVRQRRCSLFRSTPSKSLLKLLVCFPNDEMATLCCEKTTRASGFVESVIAQFKVLGKSFVLGLITCRKCYTATNRKVQQPSIYKLEMAAV